MKIKEIEPRELECAYLAVPPPVRASNDSEINSELSIQRIPEGSPESTEISTQVHQVKKKHVLNCH